VLNRNPATDNGAFSILNARLGIGAQDGSWMFESWIRNLTDETYNVGAFGVPEQTGTYDVYPNEPLTWGGTFRLHY
jgi:outer membrane receptor protein involved in Fe transport